MPAIDAHFDEPLLERSESIGRLSALLADARRGRGQIAVVTGDAGVGKSAVVRAKPRGSLKSLSEMEDERKAAQAAQIEQWAADLAAGQCPAPVQEQLYLAHRAALAATFDRIEAEAAFTRMGTQIGRAHV